MTLCASAVPAAPPPPAPAQPPQPVDPVDRRDWEDYGMDPDGPDSTHASDDIVLSLSVLMKGLLEINGDELETLLNDLSMPELGAKDGISVREAVEVRTNTI